MKKNRISVVTGASANLGRSVSIELAKSSKHIYLIGRNIKELEKTADFAEKENCETTIVPIDLTNFKLIDELGHSIYKRHKKFTQHGTNRSNSTRSRKSIATISHRNR